MSGSPSRRRRVEVDDAVGRHRLLVVIAHGDEHGVGPRRPQRLDDVGDARVGRAVRRERAVAVGPEHVRRGVGLVQMADDEIGSVTFEHAQQARQHLVVGGVAVTVPVDVVVEHAVERPVLVGRPCAHHADEMLIADDGRRGTAGGTRRRSSAPPARLRWRAMVVRRPPPSWRAAGARSGRRRSRRWRGWGTSPRSSPLGRSTSRPPRRAAPASA